jgi:hypothetical protein
MCPSGAPASDQKCVTGYDSPQGPEQRLILTGKVLEA